MGVKAFDALRSAWAGLSDRERRMLGVLGGVFAALATALPLVLIVLGNATLKQENEELQYVLDTIRKQRTKLEERAAERKAVELRYRQQAPPLGSFLEGKAKANELSISQSVDQPEKELTGFRRRNVRIDLNRVALSPVVETLASIKNSHYPVAIEKLEFSHYNKGKDIHNVTIGVVTFDRLRPNTKGENTAKGKP